MILLIDWGNTFLKCIVLDKTKIKEQLLIERVESLNEIEELSRYILERTKKNNYRTEKLSAYISSVRSSKDNRELNTLLERLTINTMFAKCQKQLHGVECAYEKVESLGIDRWLSVIASHDPNAVTGIIDIGSAITMDVINKEGQHLGGQIVPGREMLLQSLNATGQISLSKSIKQLSSQILGGSTERCVGLGLEQMIKGYLISTINDISDEFKVEQWVFTGGGGEYWMKNLLELDSVNGLTLHNSVYDPLIIFKGLIKVGLSSVN